MTDKFFEDYSGIVNVKDYGALGDNQTNDTAAIQGAFDRAFGSWTSPHGHIAPDGPRQNKAVYFPPGFYKVQSVMSAQTIISMANDGSSRFRITHGGTTPALVDGDMVYVRGVTGTGNVGNANGSYAIMNSDATHFTLRNSDCGTFTYTASSGTFCPPALRIKDVFGGKIYGAGRDVSMISMQTQKAALLSTNGFEKCCIEDIALSSPTGCVSLDLNADGTVGNLQSNLVKNCSVTSTNLTNDYCIGIGMGQNMGSENLFLGNYIGGADGAGIIVWNGNSLQNTVIGGNISNCLVGIKVNAGSCPIIQSVGFQNYQRAPNDIDILINNTSSVPTDGYVISGCRSESTNFIDSPAGAALAVLGCTHSGGAGFFLRGNARGLVAGCASAGTIEGSNPNLFMVGNNFSNAGALSSNYSGGVQNPLQRNFRQTQTSSPVGLRRYQSGTCWDNIGSSVDIDLQLPPLNDSDAIETGITYDIYVAAAHEMKFTATNGLKIRDGGTLSAANGKIASSTVGSYLSITSTGVTGDWVVKSKNGTWTVT